MPNWCNNALTIKGETKDSIEQFLAACQGQDDDGQPLKFSLKSLVPCRLADQEETWGTKWDVDEPDIAWLEDGLAMVAFSTAWEPPTGWLERVAPLYPHLEFRLDYLEMGEAFVGYCIARGGRIAEDVRVDGARDQEEYERLAEELFEFDLGFSDDADEQEDSLDCNDQEELYNRLRSGGVAWLTSDQIKALEQYAVAERRDEHFNLLSEPMGDGSFKCYLDR